MTDRAQEVLREALALPLDQRADVAAELLASLDDEPATIGLAAVEAVWGREIERRARRVMAGESDGEPWEDVRSRVARRLAER
jgi:putative addiction module component (TIGR02574 family)